MSLYDEGMENRNFLDFRNDHGDDEGKGEEEEQDHLFEKVHQLLNFTHFRPEYVVTDLISIMDSITLAPFLVEQLLKLFVRHKFLVSIKNSNIEICIVVSSVGLGLQQSLYLMFCCALIQ